MLCVTVTIIGFAIQIKDLIKAWLNGFENEVSIKGLLMGTIPLISALYIVLITAIIGAFLSICFK